MILFIQNYRLHLIVALAGLLTGVLLATIGSADAHLNPGGHTRVYSYSNSSCSTNNIVDPIGVVFTTNAQPPAVASHASHHGYSINASSPINQNFYVGGVCFGQQVSKATGCNACTRYHFRSSHYDTDTTWGTFSIATPHYETYACPTKLQHAVTSNASDPPGGFVKGRLHFWNSFYPSHTWQTQQYWDNISARPQCNGQSAWGSGYVDFWRIQ